MLKTRNNVNYAHKYTKTTKKKLVQFSCFCCCWLLRAHMNVRGFCFAHLFDILSIYESKTTKNNNQKQNQRINGKRRCH